MQNSSGHTDQKRPIDILKDSGMSEKLLSPLLGKYIVTFKNKYQTAGVKVVDKTLEYLYENIQKLFKVIDQNVVAIDKNDPEKRKLEILADEEELTQKKITKLLIKDGRTAHGDLIENKVVLLSDFQNNKSKSVNSSENVSFWNDVKKEKMEKMLSVFQQELDRIYDNKSLFHLKNKRDYNECGKEILTISNKYNVDFYEVVSVIEDLLLLDDERAKKHIVDLFRSHNDEFYQECLKATSLTRWLVLFGKRNDQRPEFISPLKIDQLLSIEQKKVIRDVLSKISKSEREELFTVLGNIEDKEYTQYLNQVSLFDVLKDFKFLPKNVHLLRKIFADHEGVSAIVQLIVKKFVYQRYFSFIRLIETKFKRIHNLENAKDKYKSKDAQAKMEMRKGNTLGKMVEPFMNLLFQYYIFHDRDGSLLKNNHKNNTPKLFSANLYFEERGTDMFIYLQKNNLFIGVDYCTSQEKITDKQDKNKSFIFTPMNFFHSPSGFERDITYTPVGEQKQYNAGSLLGVVYKRMDLYIERKILSNVQYTFDKLISENTFYKHSMKREKEKLYIVEDIGLNFDEVVHILEEQHTFPHKQNNRDPLKEYVEILYEHIQQQGSLEQDLTKQMS